MVDSLSAGQALQVNDLLTSGNGMYRLIMQSDGNLVGYDQVGRPFWSTDTWNLPSFNRPNRAVMQDDGNFVLYTPTDTPIWASNTDGNGADCRIVMQTDRNIVIYNGAAAPIWASNTVYVQRPDVSFDTGFQGVGYKKTMRTFGRLYRNGQLTASIYTKNDNWTGGLRGSVLLVIVDAAGQAIWVSSVFTAATRCSIWDPGCASYGQETFSEKYPDPVGEYADRVDVYQADSPNYVDLRNALIDGIKAAGDIAQAVKDVLGQLVK